MDQARVKPPTPAQNSTTRHAGCRQLTNTNLHHSNEGGFRAESSLKWGNHAKTRGLLAFAYKERVWKDDLTLRSIKQPSCLRKNAIQTKKSKLFLLKEKAPGCLTNQGLCSKLSILQIWRIDGSGPAVDRLRFHVSGYISNVI